MKTFPLSVMLCLCLGLASCASTSKQKRHGDNWLKPAPASWERENDLGSDEFFEVVHSKGGAALSRLKDTVAMPLKDDVVDYYTGREIKPKTGCSFYLVRAEFGNGATGGYGIEINQAGDLLIEHICLGAFESTTRSALVMMLRRRPEHVYSALSSAL